MPRRKVMEAALLKHKMYTAPHLRKPAADDAGSRMEIRVNNGMNHISQTGIINKCAHTAVAVVTSEFCSTRNRISDRLW